MSNAQAPATPSRNHHTRQFRRSFRGPALSPEQKKRQAVVTEAAWITFQAGGTMASFLNTAHPSLGGRPLDLAVDGDEGLARVLETLRSMQTNRDASFSF